MSGDPYAKAAKGRGALEQLGLSIPGFQGYLKREHRREADRLQRDHLAKGILRARDKVMEIVGELTDENKFANLELADKVQNLLQTIASKVKNADQGYSGWFDTVQIGEAELELLYEIDKSMVGYVDEIAKAVDGLDAAAEDKDTKTKLKAVEKAVKDLDTAFSKRKDKITGVA